MEKIKITLKDGSVKEVDKGITLQELAVESFFPADEATARALRAGSGG